jgi:hypothetical protein
MELWLIGWKREHPKNTLADWTVNMVSSSAWLLVLPVLLRSSCFRVHSSFWIPHGKEILSMCWIFSNPQILWDPLGSFLEHRELPYLERIWDRNPWMPGATACQRGNISLSHQLNDRSTACSLSTVLNLAGMVTARLWKMRLLTWKKWRHHWGTWAALALSYQSPVFVPICHKAWTWVKISWPCGFLC